MPLLLLLIFIFIFFQLLLLCAWCDPPAVVVRHIASPGCTAAQTLYRELWRQLHTPGPELFIVRSGCSCTRLRQNSLSRALEAAAHAWARTLSCAPDAAGHAWARTHTRENARPKVRICQCQIEQKECQTERQIECQIECQAELYMSDRMPVRMSE